MTSNLTMSHADVEDIIRQEARSKSIDFTDVYFYLNSSSTGTKGINELIFYIDVVNDDVESKEYITTTTREFIDIRDHVKSGINNIVSNYYENNHTPTYMVNGHRILQRRPSSANWECADCNIREHFEYNDNLFDIQRRYVLGKFVKYDCKS